MVIPGGFPRLLPAPTGSFFLFGPRGTGKSTWLRQSLPGALRIDLLGEGVYRALLAEPWLLAGQLARVAPRGWVVIDEVQRIPALLNEVHRQMEERRLRFALCGSSARKLKTHGTNLLAGRAARREMFPFLPEELGADFDLDEALRWGTLPVVWMAESRRDALEAYSTMYLKEEIQAEAIVRNLSGFSRFLPLAALLHGQVVNAAGLARDSGVARTTVLGYLEVLEDTLVAFRLPAYEARLRVRERKHPKLYFVDPGIARALLSRFDPPDREARGPLLEGFVAGLLRAHRSYHGLYDELSYWAPGNGSAVEVDFLLSRGRELLALEVKAKRRLAGADFRGLDAVKDLPGLRRRLLVYEGALAYRHEGIEVLPVADFLDLLERRRLF